MTLPPPEVSAAVGTVGQGAADLHTAVAAPAAVALVIVCSDERPMLEAALRSLARDMHRAAVEVTVVDNACSGPACDPAVLADVEGRIIRQPTRRRLATNLNLAISQTTAPYVLLCNSDIEFTPEAIDGLVRFLDEHPSAAVAAPRLVSPAGESRYSARRWYTVASLIALKIPGVDPNRFRSVGASRYLDWQDDHLRAVDWVPCAAALVRRRALDEIGGIDEQFRLYFVDVDLCLRMHQSGWEVWCVPDSRVVHHEQRASRRAFSKAWFSHAESLIQFLAKHRGLGPKERRDPARPRRLRSAVAATLMI